MTMSRDGAKDSPYWNLPVPTLGGKQFWADEVCDGGWRVQQNTVTGHYRLLDPYDIRRAWGSFEGCRRVLDEARPTSLTTTPHPGHVVVLLPGIWRSKDSLSKLHRAFSDAGYRVESVNYPSIVRPIEDHAAQVDRLLRRTKGLKRVSFVTHSLGGLVVRKLLGRPPHPDDPGDWRRRSEVHRVVMLFPPNRGAHKANLWHKRWWYRALMGPAGQQLTTEWAGTLPIPECPIGIIAGGRGDGRGRSAIIPGDDDGTVAVEETRLPGASHTIIDVGHAFGMNDPRVVAAAVRFIRTGALRADER